MSHRVVTETSITNKTLAIQALKSKGWTYSDEGTSLRITSGPMNRATIDLTTGNVTGDSDWHQKGSLQGLNQSYAEQKIRATLLKEGGSVQSCHMEGKRMIIMAHIA